SSPFQAPRNPGNSTRQRFSKGFASFQSQQRKRSAMTKVNRIVISGFRGICTKLDLDFQKNGQPQSIILYGANGTGKSSVTDAWEWLTTGRIQHLAREGAEESAYPHKAAKSGTT